MGESEGEPRLTRLRKGRCGLVARQEWRGATIIRSLARGGSFTAPAIDALRRTVSTSSWATPRPRLLFEGLTSHPFLKIHQDALNLLQRRPQVLGDLPG